jgi:hypothetical protein
VFVAKYYPADTFNTWRIYLRESPSIHSFANWPDLVAWPFVHIVIPFVYVFFVLYYWRVARSRPEVPWERLMLINITGLALFLTIASAPAYNRLYTVSLPGIILLVWLTGAFVPAKKILMPILWTAVLVLAVVKPLVTQTRRKAYLDLPTGRTVFFQPAMYEKTKWVAERTQPGEYFFGDQLLSFALRLRNPTPVPFLRPTDYTRPEEVRDVVQALEQHQVSLVSWYFGLDAPLDSPGNNLSPLVRYLNGHYHVEVTFLNGDKIWVRDNLARPSPSLNGSGSRSPGSRGSESDGYAKNTKGTSPSRKDGPCKQ